MPPDKTKPLKFRKLRITWSVFWGLACVLLIVSWVRSYWYADRIAIYFPTDRYVAAVSICGDIELGKYRNVTSSALLIWRETSDMSKEVRPQFEHLGFHFAPNAGGYELYVPFWFGIGVIGCVGASAWLPW